MTSSSSPCAKTSTSCDAPSTTIAPTSSSPTYGYRRRTRTKESSSQLDLRKTHPTVGVIVLSQHAEPAYALSLFAETTERRAYLLKDRVRDDLDLQRAVRDVASGGAVVDSHVVDELLRARERSDDARLGGLTAREQDILRLIAEGRSNQAVASELGVTTRSVEHSINTIFTKLGLRASVDVNRRVKATLMYLAGSVDGDLE